MPNCIKSVTVSYCYVATVPPVRNSLIDEPWLPGPGQMLRRRDGFVIYCQRQATRFWAQRLDYRYCSSPATSPARERTRRHLGRGGCCDKREGAIICIERVCAGARDSAEAAMSPPLSCHISCGAGLGEVEMGGNTERTGLMSGMSSSQVVTNTNTKVFELYKSNCARERDVSDILVQIYVHWYEIRSMVLN